MSGRTWGQEMKKRNRAPFPQSVQDASKLKATREVFFTVRSVSHGLLATRPPILGIIRMFGWILFLFFVFAAWVGLPPPPPPSELPKTARSHLNYLEQDNVKTRTGKCSGQKPQERPCIVLSRSACSRSPCGDDVAATKFGQQRSLAGYGVTTCTSMKLKTSAGHAQPVKWFIVSRETAEGTPASLSAPSATMVVQQYLISLVQFPCTSRGLLRGTVFNVWSVASLRTDKHKPMLAGGMMRTKELRPELPEMQTERLVLLEARAWSAVNGQGAQQYTSTR